MGTSHVSLSPDVFVFLIRIVEAFSPVQNALLKVGVSFLIKTSRGSFKSNTEIALCRKHALHLGQEIAV